MEIDVQNMGNHKAPSSSSPTVYKDNSKISGEDIKDNAVNG